MCNYSGKNFEEDFRNSVKGTKLDKGLLRLYDAQGGYCGISNPADFILYNYPNMFLLELKAVQDKRLDFSKIRPNQIEGLDSWSKNKGVIAGIMVNFYTYGTIYFIPIDFINELKESGRKSINIDMCDKYCYKVDGSKKRTRFRVNVLKFVEDIPKWEQPFIELGE